MREIKFSYVWRRKEDGYIYETLTPIECLEGKGDKPFLGNSLWDLVARRQFIGLSAKKDDLYDGDIISSKSPHNDEWNTWAIEFKFGSFLMKFINGSHRPPNGFILAYDFNLEIYEKIGNIYENHELIKQ